MTLILANPSSCDVVLASSDFTGCEWRRGRQTTKAIIVYLMLFSTRNIKVEKCQNVNKEIVPSEQDARNVVPESLA